MKKQITKLKSLIGYYRLKNNKNKEYKDMVSGIKLRKLTKEQIKLTQDYYIKKTGRKIDLKWHRYYYSVNGVFTPYYLPVEMYYATIIPSLNRISMSGAYADKNITDKLFPNVLQPLSIVKNINGFYYINNKPTNRTKAVQACRNLPDAVIKKSIESAQGKSIIRFSSSNGVTSHNNMTIEELINLYDDNYIIQEAVKQHPIFSSLNPTSLNTVRLVTYRKENDVNILTALVRMGRKGAKVDNASAGGIFCRIDSNGKLDKYAYSLFPTSIYEKNDYGIVFSGIQIPCFSQITELAKSLHPSLPYSKIVGWDFSVNENNEVVLIEVNLSTPGVYQLLGPAFGDYTDEVISYVYNQ